MTKFCLKSILCCLGFLGLCACSDDDDEKGPALDPIDYAQDEHWLKLSTDTNYGVDVFYLYPTVWTPTENDKGYCELDNASLRQNAPKVYHDQAQVFESMANVYAPWYRQLDAMKTLGKTSEEVDDMLRAIPYKDALSAFEYYLKNYNEGRPFILASHSQGSSVFRVLLQDYMKQHPEVSKRMVAAYMLGYSFEDQYFKKNTHLKFAKGETDTGVIISWNCERLIDGKFGTFNNVCYPGALAINPISWTRDEEVVPADDPRNLGSKIYPDLRCSTQVRYDANRGYHVLILGIDSDDYDISFIGDQCLHGLDFSLFTENIKDNAQKRFEAFKAQK